MSSESKPDSHDDSLEQLLLARNKKLNTELTILRVAHEEATQRLAKAETDLASTHSALEQSQSLNRKLEEDLTLLHESTTGINSGPMSVASYAPSRRSGYTGGGGADSASLFGGSLRAGLTSFVPGGADDDTRSQAGSGTLTPGGRSLDQHVADLTILPIITQQRDRFRARNAELEQELRSEYGRITELRSQIERLQKDNVALYEKTRYLSTYRSTTSAAQINAGIDESSSYGRDYAEHISPFAQFRGREQERALSRMGPLERIIYGLTRVVLANKTSRNMFFAYVTGLHLFLMGTIWYLALGEVGRHDNITDAPHTVNILAGEKGIASDTVVEVTDPMVPHSPSEASAKQEQVISDAVANTVVAAVQATATAVANMVAQATAVAATSASNPPAVAPVQDGGL